MQTSLNSGPHLFLCEPIYKLFLRKAETPYGEIPVYRVTPSDWLETIFGLTPIYDLLGIQQAVDSLYSMVFTNQSNFGVSEEASLLLI